MNTKNKPKRTPNLDKVLARLKEATEDRKGASEARIRSAASTLPCRIPPVWQKVMSITDGGAIFTRRRDLEEFDMSKSRDFAKNNNFARRFIKQGWPDLPAHYLAVVANENQDFIFLDTSKVNRDGDCPALLVDHEECRVQKKWPNIASLLDYVLKAGLTF